MRWISRRDIPKNKTCLKQPLKNRQDKDRNVK